jgi:hypothetical protein
MKIIRICPRTGAEPAQLVALPPREHKPDIVHKQADNAMAIGKKAVCAVALNRQKPFNSLDDEEFRQCRIRSLNG